MLLSARKRTVVIRFGKRPPGFARSLFFRFKSRSVLGDLAKTAQRRRSVDVNPAASTPFEGLEGPCPLAK